jgi:Histone methylation protein DOT1
MDKWLARLRYALRRHGPVGFIWLAGYNLVYFISRRDRNADRTAQADEFDGNYGTETSGMREIGTLDVVSSAAARYAVRYDPSNPEVVRTLISKLKIDYSRFTFIDFGSGKGRVLLVAAGFPFKEVIGVEFSRELHEVALKNIAHYPRNETHAGTVRSIHHDASEYEPPPSDLVCYFYNPFGAPIMEKVATRLAALHERDGYRVIIIYVDPRHPDIFEKTTKFAVLTKAPDALIMTTDLRPAPTQ